MMQMLAVGGFPVLTDNLRTPDEDNPSGYLEWEPVKHLRQEPNRIAEAEGKVVKVISPLLSCLPPQYAYRVIFMLRPEKEIISSQAEMMRRRKTAKLDQDAAEVQRVYEKHLHQVLESIEQQPQFELLLVSYPDLILEPRKQVYRVRQFLRTEMEVETMIRQVNPSLYRNRS